MWFFNQPANPVYRRSRTLPAWTQVLGIRLERNPASPPFGCVTYDRHGRRKCRFRRSLHRPTAMDGGSVDIAGALYRPVHCLHGCRYLGFVWNEILPVHKKPRTRAGFWLIYTRWSLLRLDVACLWAFLTHFHVVAYSLAFGQCLKARTGDRGEVYKHVCAAIGGRNKTEAFGFVKPFNCAGSHVIFL
jgi:hypothetical protein